MNYLLISKVIPVNKNHNERSHEATSSLSTIKWLISSLWKLQCHHHQQFLAWFLNFFIFHNNNALIFSSLVDFRFPCDWRVPLYGWRQIYFGFRIRLSFTQAQWLSTQPTLYTAQPHKIGGSNMQHPPRNTQYIWKFATMTYLSIYRRSVIPKHCNLSIMIFALLVSPSRCLHGN